MFGYVTPLKPELKVREYTEFKAYYCGVCFSIKKQFGNIPRMTLNYDMTFLALLLDGLSPDNITAKQKRCLAHPTQKKPVIYDNDAIDYAANMNVSLVYFKLIDDVNDDKDLKSKSLALGLSPYRRKFSKEIIPINEIIKENLNKLSILENTKNFTSIDEICDPFSVIVGKILELYPKKIVNDSDYTRYVLYNFGYSLGKWIYLVDALDDLKEDMENNKFNPINYLYNTDNLKYEEFIETIKERIEFSILSCACTCKESLNNLKLQRNKEILENIIDLGMMDKYKKVVSLAQT
ncbi:MAG: hypothetical protein E7214_03460 [Clostridium sp.]|nr:hypothetical protein [Clostridium sp.]